MILTIDVGNTNTVIGRYEGDRLCDVWRMDTVGVKIARDVAEQIADLFALNRLDIHSVQGVIIESVVPRVTPILEDAITECFHIKPVIVEPGMDTGIKITYQNPETLGLDRLVNAVAAYLLYGGPVIVVDFGTATKFCAISASGEHLGGVICPGIKLCVEALTSSAAKLTSVELKRPATVLTDNTEQSIQAGLFYGYEGMVKHILSQMKSELGDENIKVVATGGLAHYVCDDNDMVDEINDHLTLEGLKILYKRKLSFKNRCTE